MNAGVWSSRWVFLWIPPLLSSWSCQHVSCNVIKSKLTAAVCWWVSSFARIRALTKSTRRPSNCEAAQKKTKQKVVISILEGVIGVLTSRFIRSLVCSRGGNQLHGDKECLVLQGNAMQVDVSGEFFLSFHIRTKNLSSQQWLSFRHRVAVVRLLRYVRHWQVLLGLSGHWPCEVLYAWVYVLRAAHWYYPDSNASSGPSRWLRLHHSVLWRGHYCYSQQQLDISPAARWLVKWKWSNFKNASLNFNVYIESKP